MREGPRFRKARNCVQPRSSAGADDDLGPAETTRFSIRLGDFEGSGRDKASRTHDQNSSALFVFVAMEVDVSGNHPAFTVSHGGHIYCEPVRADAELLAPSKVR